MSAPSGFDIGRQVGQNFAQVRQGAKDDSAIESILSQAMNSGNPEVVQNSIGQILSQVSPERQGVALQYLQNTYNQILQKQEKSKAEATGRAAAQQAGYTYGAPPGVQAQQVKDQSKAGRLAQYGLGGDNSMNPMNANLPNAENGTPALLQGSNSDIMASQVTSSESPFKRMSKDKLKLLSGHPDREVSEPAKAELRDIEQQEKLNQKRDSDKIKRHTDLSQQVLKKADEIAEALPQKESALNLMEDAIANRDLSFWTKDNLAELTGIEGFRSQEGAIFKTAGKEYFLGNLMRAGARPNQWIEQQISDMLTKIGRTPEANLSVSRALRNELGIEKERVRLTEEISNQLESSLGYVPRDLGSRVNKELSKFAEAKQKELYNDLRAIKAIAEKSPQKFNQVAEGTPVSKVVAQALLKQFNNDPKKAADEAKNLGYVF